VYNTRNASVPYEDITLNDGYWGFATKLVYTNNDEFNDIITTPGTATFPNFYYTPQLCYFGTLNGNLTLVDISVGEILCSIFLNYTIRGVPSICSPGNFTVNMIFRIYGTTDDNWRAFYLTSDGKVYVLWCILNEFHFSYLYLVILISLLLSFIPLFHNCDKKDFP